MDPKPKFNFKKWLLIGFLAIVAIVLMNIKINMEEKVTRPSFYEVFSQRSQRHIDDIKSYAYQIYSVMIEEVQNDKQNFANIMIIGFLGIGIIAILIIIAITRLPAGYLAKLDKYSVIKKSEIEASTNHERSKT
ncbi:MAG: hypothetical protein KAW01_04955 [Deltaproteobacteria bacterium]|nr:hypothetical protein [Deltaproteobacteria bacterium]